VASPKTCSVCKAFSRQGNAGYCGRFHWLVDCELAKRDKLCSDGDGETKT
jgi:hypothetical protein